MKRPNILLIMTDQHHFQALSCAGHPVVRTPNIDRLAQRGVIFDRAYCPSPVCGPARAAIFSGLYPRQNDVLSNTARMRRGVDLLPQLVQRAGYHTALVGKLHLIPEAAPHGFSRKKRHDAPYDTYYAEHPWLSDYVGWLARRRFSGDVQQVIDYFNADEECLRDDLSRFLLGSNRLNEEDHYNTWVADEACAVLRQAQTPFFLFASFFGPHQPMAAPGRWSEMYDPQQIPLPETFGVSMADKPIARHTPWTRKFGQADFSEAHYRRLLAAYYGQISMIDEGVGRILDQLDRQGLRDETLVIFTADHGDHAGQFGWFFKGTMYEGAAHVPLILHAPAEEAAHGARCDRVVNNLDLFETVLDYAAGPRPGYATASRSLTPLMRDPASSAWRNETYSEIRKGDEFLTMLVRDNFKLLRRPVEDQTLHELYDLRRHPPDGENLWEDPKHDRARAEMESRLDELEQRAVSPLEQLSAG